MAQDDQQRFDRQGRPLPRTATGNDPLAELARLIGQSDPFAEFGRGQPQPQPQQTPSWGVPGEGPGFAAPPVAPEAAYGVPGYGHAPHQAAPHYDQNFAQHDYQAQQGEQPYDPNYYYPD